MTRCRYDFIYISSEIQVHRVHYRFDESVRAVSDHALVTGEFEL